MVKLGAVYFSERGIVLEFFKGAITGINVIPTALLIVMLIYWVGIIIGALGIDFLDFDFDGEAQEGPLQALISFLNIGNVPSALVLSMIILNLWILTMLMSYLPIKLGGVITGILMIPALVISIFIAGIETRPLKRMFTEKEQEEYLKSSILQEICWLKNDLYGDRLGQAMVKRDGANIIINVKSDVHHEKFSKDEEAFIIRRDPDKNIYYIVKMEESKYGCIKDSNN